MEHAAARARLNYDLGRWFEHAWNVFRARILGFVILMAVATIPAVIMGSLYAGATGFLPASSGRSHSEPLFPVVASGRQVIVIAGYAVLNAALYIPLLVGVAAVALSAVRTQVFDWAAVWTGFKRWPSSFAVGLVPQLVAVIPSAVPVLWVLLPVWLGVMLWQLFAAYSLADGSPGCYSALRRGWNLVRGNFWRGILFMFVATVVSGLGVVACCVGLFFTGAFYQALIAVAYDDLTRQMGALREPTEGQTTL